MKTRLVFLLIIIVFRSFTQADLVRYGLELDGQLLSREARTLMPADTGFGALTDWQIRFGYEQEYYRSSLGFCFNIETTHMMTDSFLGKIYTGGLTIPIDMEIGIQFHKNWKSRSYIKFGPSLRLFILNLYLSEGTTTTFTIIDLAGSGSPKGILVPGFFIKPGYDFFINEDMFFSLSTPLTMIPSMIKDMPPSWRFGVDLGFGFRLR